MWQALINLITGNEMTKYLKELEVGNQVIRAVEGQRYYENVHSVTSSHIILVRYPSQLYQLSDGKSVRGKGKAKEVSETVFIVSNPTKSDYENAERNDLINGISLGVTLEKLTELDLETLRKLANILY